MGQNKVFSNMVYAVEQWGGAPSATGNMCIQVDEGYFRAMSTAEGLGMDTNKSTSGRYVRLEGFWIQRQEQLGQHEDWRHRLQSIRLKHSTPTPVYVNIHVITSTKPL